jgi:hypothetical protein
VVHNCNCQLGGAFSGHVAAFSKIPGRYAGESPGVHKNSEMVSLCLLLLVLAGFSVASQEFLNGLLAKRQITTSEHDELSRQLRTRDPYLEELLRLYSDSPVDFVLEAAMWLQGRKREQGRPGGATRKGEGGAGAGDAASDCSCPYSIEVEEEANRTGKEGEWSHAAFTVTMKTGLFGAVSQWTPATDPFVPTAAQVAIVLPKGWSFRSQWRHSEWTYWAYRGGNEEFSEPPPDCIRRTRLWTRRLCWQTAGSCPAKEDTAVWKHEQESSGNRQAREWGIFWGSVVVFFLGFAVQAIAAMAVGRSQFLFLAPALLAVYAVLYYHTRRLVLLLLVVQLMGFFVKEWRTRSRAARSFKRTTEKKITKESFLASTVATQARGRSKGK